MNTKLSESKLLPKRAPRILLVDDDPVFGSVMAKVAQLENMALTYYASVRDIYREIENLDFDVAVVDYNLGCVTGTQLSNFLARHAKSAPVILISASAIQKSDFWPEQVKSIEEKRKGALGILHSALRAFDDSEKQKDSMAIGLKK